MKKTKTYKRQYMLNDSGVYYPDVSITIYPGEKIKDAVQKIHSGTNFFCKSLFIRKNTIFEKIYKKN